MNFLQQNFKIIPSYTLFVASFFSLPFNSHAQEVYNVGGAANYNYVNENSYDFVTGNAKTTTGKYLEIKLNAWNVNDRNYQIWGALTNLPKSYSSQFIFVPTYRYDRNGRPRPSGRNTPSWVSLYGSFTEHNPADWKKQSYNWPYGGESQSSKAIFRGSNYTTVALDLLEASWKYGKKRYSSLGSIENNLYQYNWSTHGDFFRERSNRGRGSIPGRNDPTPEFFIPDGFWNSHNYAHIQVLTTSIFEENPYMNVNFKTAYNRLGLWHTYDTFLFPFVENGVKKTLVNNSPVVYYFGAQGAYSGSESTFLSFAQDKEGDQLIYRWVDGTNLSESESYANRNNSSFLYAYKNGYSADKPLKENTVPADNFYINPYSGTVNFTNSTGVGLRKSFVAIDQYKDGQLVGTIINQVPFFSQSQSSSNTAPLIEVSSTTNTIAQKTSFDFDTDIPNSPSAINPPTHIKPYIASTKTRLRVPYTEVNNNGEVLLEGLDAGEGETVSFNIEVSDAEDDDIVLEILPVDSDLMDSYPWTLTPSGTNIYNFEWNTPADLDTETALGSKSYLFMLYAKDNNEVLEGLPGRALKPISITVHKRPSVAITSTNVNSGDTSNDSQINIQITLTDIDVTSLSDTAFTLTTNAFDLTNATLTNLTKTNNYSYNAVLNITDNLDVTIAPVSTSVAINEDKFSISKTGGHRINQVSLSNKGSNVFEWTADKIRPRVSFDFFDTNGASLTTNSQTNDAYIVGKISVSKATSNFVASDLIFNHTNSSSSVLQKIEDVTGTYYSFKINASANTTGHTKITIPENILSDRYGNQNLIGKLSSDNSVTEFVWNFDLIKPTVTITNPFESVTTTDLSGEITFAFSEAVTFNNKNFSDFTNDDKTALISVLNANTTNAFFTDFVFNANSPNQFKATINHGGGNKTVVINAIEDFVRDLYGNSSTESSSSHSYNLDFPRLTNIYHINSSRINRNGPLTYSQGNELSFLTSTVSVDVLLSFSGQSENQSENTNNIGYQSLETGLSFDISNNDIDVSSGTLSNFQYFGLGSEVDESGNIEQLFIASYTPNLDYNGYVTFTIDADKFSNVSGVNNIISSKQILVDTNPPSVTFNLYTQYGTPFNKAEITNENYLLVEAKFSEPVDGFTVSDLINGNTYQHKFPVISDFTKINDVLYTFKVTHTNGDGEYSFVNKNKSFKDKQGIENTDWDLFHWYFDTTGPTAAIEIYNGANNIQNQEFTANNSTNIKYVFSEPGISTIEPGAELVELLNLYTENINISTASFNITRQTITAVGEINAVGAVKINLPNNLFKDRGGNLNTQAIERIYFYDNSVPEPSIGISNLNAAIENNATFNAESITVTYNFSVPLPATNYSDYSLTALEDILSTQISNGTLSNLQKVDENTFSGTISNFDNGAIIVGFPKDLVFTEAGIKNTKANNVTIFLDNENPEATILLKLAAGEILENDTKTNQSLVYATITTSEVTTNLSLDDFNFTVNVNASNFTQIDDLTYTFQLENTASSDVSISLNSNKFTDNVGNANSEPQQISYNFDNVRPVPTITSSLINNGDTTNATTVPIEITFSEESLFMQDASRIASFISTIIENGSVTEYSKDGNTIRFNINRVANGLVSIQLPENVFYDLHANGNTASAFQFRFEGAINLSRVELSSDNSLEQDYTLSYTWGGSAQTRTVPGTRTLIAQDEIDYLYVNNSHTVTLNITAEADINIAAILIDGQTLTASQVNGNAREWRVDLDLSSATTEGKIDFEIRFTDSNGTSQSPIKETTDGIYYKKDFTAPILSAKIIKQGDTPVEIAYDNEPLLNAIHSFELTANETLYEEKAFALVSNIDPSKTNNIYRGDLARFAAKLHYTQRFIDISDYHNPELLSERPSTSLPYDSFYTYFNGNIPSSESYIYTDDYLILYPKYGNGNYQLEVPENYFYDLAGNKSTGLTISGLKLFQEANGALTSAEINKKSCENITKAAFKRIRSSSASYVYFETNIIVEVSDNENFTTKETLGFNRIRETNSTEITTNTTANTGSELKKEYELDLEATTWVRFKTIDKISKELSTYYTEYFDESRPYDWKELISYSNPVKITVVPNTISVTGTNGICGLNEQETFTVNTTGGLWSVSDNSIATINENTGVLTTLKTGSTNVIYTTTDGCSYLKKVRVFDTTTVQIEANGQDSFCEGSSVIITGSISENTTWYKDDVVQPQLTSNTVTLSKVSDSGTYYISYLTPCGAIVSNKIKVKVNPLPTASKINTNE